MSDDCENTRDVLYRAYIQARNLEERSLSGQILRRAGGILLQVVIASIGLSVHVANGQTFLEPAAGWDESSVQERIIDSVFPLEAQNGGVLALGFRRYRLYSSDSVEDLEYSVLLEWVQTPNDARDVDLIATVTTAKGYPVSFQVLESLPDGGAMPEPMALLERIEIDRWSIAEESCPELQGILLELERLPLPSIAFDHVESGEANRIPIIFVHPTTYELVATRSGASIRLAFYNVEFPQLRDWMRESRVSIEDCIEVRQ